MKVAIFLTVLLLMPMSFALVSEEIYSSYTTHPSFFCPPDVIKCEMYETIDSMNRNITPPKLIKECLQSTECSYVNDVGDRYGFRLLPGDVSLGAAQFKGYKIFEGVETTTTTFVTTTSTTTNTVSQYLECSSFNFWSCVTKSECQWIGQMIGGYCSKKGQAKTTSITTTEFVTSTFIPTTTTLLECFQPSVSCSSNSDCCSGVCVKKCINPSIFGFCLFGLYSGKCM